MKDIDVILSILLDGVEDYSCLYEIIWSLNTRFKDKSEEVKRKVALKNVITLLEKDYIQLYWSHEPTEQLHKILEKKEAIYLIQQQKYWNTPSDEKWIRFSSTNRGEKVLWKCLPKRKEVFSDLF